ncbi:dimethylamine monooxygenase subunit DmmA family protein [Methylobacillus pratensis]
MQHGYWIRSKPVYASLAWQHQAQAHVVLAQGEAGRAVLRLYQQRLPEQPGAILYLTSQETDYTAALKSLAGDSVQVFTSQEALWAAFDALLSNAYMGTRLYAAGDEDFLWQVSTLAAKHGVLNADIMREQHVSLARPVYCVHCKTITPHVTTNIAVCVGCRRHLFVRDHFSRRLGAYMGLMVDAEAPGEIPAAEEIYP